MEIKRTNQYTLKLTANELVSIHGALAYLIDKGEGDPEDLTLREQIAEELNRR